MTNKENSKTMESPSTDDLIYAAFFFIDIVGLSNPVLSTETQRKKIKVLNELIYSCKNFSGSDKEKVMILPTGDGMLIGFKTWSVGNIWIDDSWIRYFYN